MDFDYVLANSVILMIFVSEMQTSFNYSLSLAHNVEIIEAFTLNSHPNVRHPKSSQRPYTMATHSTTIAGFHEASYIYKHVTSVLFNPFS